MDVIATTNGYSKTEMNQKLQDLDYNVYLNIKNYDNHVRNEYYFPLLNHIIQLEKKIAELETKVSKLESKQS